MRRLRSIYPLTPEDADLLLTLPIQIREIGADQDVVREGERPSHSFVLLEGITAIYKIVGQGRRQIMSFNVPGDLPDIQSLHLSVMDCGISTLTRCRIGAVSHEALRDLCHRAPNIADAFWKATLIDAAVFREWIVNIGQRDARARLAHVLCEMFVRLRAVGLTRGNVCEMPISQLELADATGMSTVHVNRVIQDLRREKMLNLDRKGFEVLDWNALQRVADFDPTYLHLLAPH